MQLVELLTAVAMNPELKVRIIDGNEDMIQYFSGQRSSDCLHRNG